MIQVGDTILYGATGVCTVTDITTMKMDGVCKKYYVLRPSANENATVYVPLENEGLVGKMRRILSKEEILSLIRSMPQRETDWIEDEFTRKETYRQILSSGDRSSLIGMIKALHQHSQKQQANKRHLHLSDERFLKDAEKLLHEEFALVLGIKQEQVLPFILRQIGEDEM